jgi:hypothetical protein
VESTVIEPSPIGVVGRSEGGGLFSTVAWLATRKYDCSRRRTYHVKIAAPPGSDPEPGAAPEGTDPQVERVVRALWTDAAAEIHTA